MKRLLFHGSVLIHHLFVSYFFLNHLDFSVTEVKSVLNMNKYRFLFLTGWNFKIQTMYFFICVLEELIALTKASKGMKQMIRTYKTFIFTACVFPLSMFVSLMFWTLFAINRELVYPMAADAVFPTWLNHAMHTNITVVIMLEMFMSYHWYNKRKIAVIVLNTFMFVYVCCLLVTYFINGDWLYPIFGTMDWSQRIFFYVVTHILVMATYMIGELLNNIIWEEKIKKRARKMSERLQLSEESKAYQTGMTSS